MTEHMRRFLSMLIEGLLAPAMRLMRLAAVRHEIDSYKEALEEAAALERSGNTTLAQHLRGEMNEILTNSSFPAAGPALNGDRRPFAALQAPRLGEPGLAGPSSDPEGEGSPPPRRRGRRPGSKGRPPEATESGDTGASETPPAEPQPMGEMTWPEDV